MTDSPKRLDDRKTRQVAGLIRARLEQPIGKLLVVGCGSGVEAAVLARELACQVVGVDISSRFNPEAAKLADLRVGDATRLEFPDVDFDFVYSYHALEHIPEHHQALQEMRRVLKPGGAFWIGTPNKLRVVGYLGSKTASLKQKIEWNLRDWRAKLQGRFENRYGAHAGFTRKELRADIGRAFDEVQDQTLAYYEAIYPGQRRQLRAMEATGLGERVFPCVYFAGRKLAA